MRVGDVEVGQVSVAEELEALGLAPAGGVDDAHREGGVGAFGGDLDVDGIVGDALLGVGGRAQPAD